MTDDTFAGQQRQSEDAQLTAGRGQVHAIQGVIRNQMNRMMTMAEEAGHALPKGWLPPGISFM